MFRLGVIALALCSSLVLAQDAGTPKFQGKKVRVVEQGVQVGKLLQLIADISKLNVVLLDAPKTPTLDVKAEDQPWDQLLEDVVARSGLSMKREGNVVIVAAAARLAARASANFTGKRQNFFFENADVRDAAELISRASGLDLGATAGTKPVSAKLRNVPGDQAIALVLELADAKAAPRKANTEKGCAAPSTPLEKVKLTATATGTAKPLAVVTDESGRGWIAELKGCVGVENAVIKTLLPDELITSGTHDLTLFKGALAHAGPKSESVTIESLLKEMEAPGALTGTGLSEALMHKKLVLHFLRDVMRLEKVDEPLPRDAVARLTVVPYELGAKVDEAIAKGLRAKPAVLKPFLTEPFSIEGSALVACWLRLESDDRMNGPQLVSKLVSDLEGNATEMLALATQLEGKEVKVLPEAPPTSVKYLPLAIGKLGKLGVTPKETAALDKRAKALKARYAGR